MVKIKTNNRYNESCYFKHKVVNQIQSCQKVHTRIVYCNLLLHHGMYMVKINGYMKSHTVHVIYKVEPLLTSMFLKKHIM